MAMTQPTPPAPVVPYFAWNRLETRPRKPAFDHVLKAEIHDSLWMLGRQWQMGEYKGNDTGSGILARVQMDYFTINGIAPYGQSPQGYSQDIPMEPVVESIPYNWSKKERILMGKKWLYFINKYAPSTYSTYASLFTGHYALQLPAIFGSTDPQIMNEAEVYSNKKLANFITGTSFAGLSVDGANVYKVINSSTWNSDLSSAFGGAPGATLIASDLNAARSAFINWMQQMYTFPDGNANWDNNSLEYKFDTYWPVDGSNSICLSAPHYHQGHFDWYAFNQVNDPLATVTNPVVTTKALQLIMAQNRFAGMPASRWWEFENGGVNFCNLDGNSTDIAKIIMTQFALVYQDDWFVVPYKVPVGSYSEVKGIVVSDVFGVNTFIANYPIEDYVGGQFTDNGSNEWKSWRWLDITKQPAGTGTATPSTSHSPAGAQVIFPVVNKMTESKPLESITFVRDEIADMVWGIETIVPNEMGRGMDGHDRSKAYTDFLVDRKKDLAPLPVTLPDPDAKISYKLTSTDVPENWIPFMPVHLAGSNRKTQFQRAVMPRILDHYDDSLVRPRTELLRYGLGTTYQPYYIYEEEITKAGIIVETTMQRTRWYNGKIVSWLGRRKYTGRGQGNSKLIYDNIVDVTE